MSSPNQNTNSDRGGSGKSDTRFVARFKHWRSGEIIEAKNYGLKGFPIGRKGKK
jgi:hypothetical protein